MSYAIIAGVLFAWIVTLAWAGKEIADARKAQDSKAKKILSQLVNYPVPTNVTFEEEPDFWNASAQIVSLDRGNR